MTSRHLSGPLALALLSSAALAQVPDPNPPAVDPYTKGDAKAMEQLGVVGYGSMPLCTIRTDDVDRVLGEGRIAWVETAHFRLGTTLKTAQWPGDAKARKEVQEEMERLSKRSSKIKRRPSDFPPWLRLHLYAQRSEEIFADLAGIIGQPDGVLPEGPYLGLKEKPVVMLFEKKSDLTRFADRFFGRQAEQSLRHYDAGAQTMVVGVAAENDPPYDDADVHSTMAYLLARSLVEGLHGRVGNTPEWLSSGLGHIYERQVTSRVINVAMGENEAVDPHTQHEWEDKMKARARHDGLLLPFTELIAMNQLSYYPTLQAWSRVDFLLRRNKAQFGAFLVAAKKKAKPESQVQALQELFELEPEAFDKEWQAWAQKFYK